MSKLEEAAKGSKEVVSKEAKEAPSIAGDGRRVRTEPVKITRDSLRNRGPLACAKLFKRPGYKNFWMRDSVEDSYAFDKYWNLGYDFVRDEKGKVVSVGRSSERMFLLEIPEELHSDILQAKHELKLEETERRKQQADKPSQNQV